MNDSVHTRVVLDHTLVITLNRPEVRNAINDEVSAGLRSAFDRLDSDEGLRVGILAGSGPGFCTGLDLKEFGHVGKPHGIQQVLRNDLRKPLIAAIHGFALGGGLELALLADIVVAEEKTVLGLPQTRVGLFPSGGALLRLREMLPRPLIAELAFTGRCITAEQALHYGLVTQLTPSGGAVGGALEIAHLIAENAPLGVAACKELLQLDTRTTVDVFWRRQRELASKVFLSLDAEEGASAFAEDRAPQWRNR